MIDFTYKGYEQLIELLRTQKYHITDYRDYTKHRKSVILRHDVDYDINKAKEFSKFEEKVGVHSTYFFLLTSDFYNLFSKNSILCIEQVKNCGHEIGLHFDEARYCSNDKWDKTAIIGHIFKELNYLSKIIGTPVNIVSMHRPSKLTLESDLSVPGAINSSGKEFFKNCKYVSDSRMHWRENVESVILSGLFDKLHILTHTFWYDTNEHNIKDTINNFLNNAEKDRYCLLNDNITRLDQILH